MTDASADFLAALGSRGEEPLLERANGTLRVELVDAKRTDRWLVGVKRGQVSVSHKGGEADCVVTVPRSLFDQLVTGKANALTALLRGELAIDGDYNLLVLVQRIFPGPPRRRQRPKAGYARRQT